MGVEASKPRVRRRITRKNKNNKPQNNKPQNNMNNVDVNKYPSIALKKIKKLLCEQQPENKNENVNADFEKNKELLKQVRQLVGPAPPANA